MCPILVLRQLLHYVVLLLIITYHNLFYHLATHGNNIWILYLLTVLMHIFQPVVVIDGPPWPGANYAVVQFTLDIVKFHTCHHYP